MAGKFKVAIVGSGPAGMSAGGRAAETNVSHILFEKSDHLSDTIYKYQKGKFVMATPDVLPLRSPMTFQAGIREDILGTWDKEAAKHKVNVRFKSEVVAIKGQKGNFELRVQGGGDIVAEYVILCIGLQGNLRKLECEGADRPWVQYQLDDPDAYSDETIVVIGAGDAAIENAVALAKQNKVIIVNRRDEFARVKQGNLNLIAEAIDKGIIECYYNSEPGHIGDNYLLLKTAEGEAKIECNRIIARLGADPPRRFVESCGIKFPSKDRAALPELSGSYESNVPGLYILGALGGYPLIKQAMNQGYEVIEFIEGRPVKPADEPLLESKFANINVPVEEMLQRIRQNVPLLSGLTTLQLREFMIDSNVHTPRRGDVIFHRNDYTNSFFSIVQGNVDIQINPTNTAEVVGLGQGQFFGEMGLISGRRRTATTISASDDCVLIETPRRSMIKLVNSVAAVKKVLDQTAMARQIQTHLAPAVPTSELQEVVESAKIESYPAGHVIFNEGDQGDAVYLIRRGSVTVSRSIAGRNLVLSYVPAGNYVGEMALLSRKPRSATIKTAVATEAVRLDGSAFNKVLDKYPDLRRRLEAKYDQRLVENVRMEASPESGSLIEFLVAQGVGEATDVLLIDESLCVRCDNCEKACAETHGGTSRLDREAGPTFASLHVPTSCRHCEHPHCMADCPADAIHRASNGEVFIDDKCIGCGNCERNCPYQVIHMAAKPPAKPGLLQWLLFGMGPGPGEDLEAKKIKSSSPKLAVKCDMCKDLAAGPACVRACPTGAAIRVNPEDFFALTIRG
ncbi:MAG: cyclic nucleotide-binding domain-containing protein [Alphaproteobacteria bacterium]|nr:cyclic nucleotide-binding domain-containing protein [Alphaproteobacteria bacterium]